MTQHAGVVELADTWDLKSHIREDVRVRTPSPAPASEQTALHYVNRHSRKAVPVDMRSAPFAPNDLSN